MTLTGCCVIITIVANDWLNCAAAPPWLRCRSGGIGRRTGLKILRGQTRTGSSPVSGILAQIAQLVEQWTENPRVTGSIPVLGIFPYAGVVQW